MTKVYEMEDNGIRCRVVDEHLDITSISNYEFQTDRAEDLILDINLDDIVQILRDIGYKVEAPNDNQ